MHAITRLYRLLVVAVILITISLVLVFRPKTKPLPPPPSASDPATAQPAPLALGKPLPRLMAPEPAQPAGRPVAGWTNAAVLAEEQELLGSGSRIRVQILAPPGSHYPVRVEETLERIDNAEVVTARLEMAAGHLLAELKPGANAGTVLNALRSAGVVAVHPLGNGPLVRLDLADAGPRAVPEAIAGLAAAEGLLEYGEPDYVVHAAATNPNDPAYSSGELWAMRNTGQSGGVADADIDADEAWDTRTDASSVIVAVVDTGIRYTHQDLAENMWVNPGEIAGDGIDNDGNGIIDDVYGYNAINGSGNPMDDNGHGTHVSGTIGGRGNNGTGVAGVAWRVRLLGAKFLSGSGSGFTSDAVLVIDYARQMGAQVMNNSWGGSGASSALVNAIDRARQAGILFVAAAGNSSANADTAPLYPAAYTNDNIVSVAAITRTDALASFSNFGLRTVDIAAPGASIYSTYNTSDSAYTTLNGTSMATPHVSGALAVLRAQFPGAAYAGLIERLLATADHPAGLSGLVRSQGRLNLARALTETVIISPPAIVEEPASIHALAGATVEFSATASGGTPLGYQWRKNGFVLADANGPVLVLTNVQSGDAGRYSLLVSNAAGLALSGDATLTVNLPVAITTQPQGATVPTDATCAMSVQVSGDPPFAFQWRKGGVDLVGKTAATLNFHGTTTDDSGAYTVVAANEASSVTSAPAVLTVIGAPVIALQPQNQTGYPGGSVQFTPAAQGSGLSHQWFRDGVLLAGATTSNLTLTPLSAANVGSYSLRVTNIGGQTWSAAAALTLKASSGATGYPAFTQHPADQTVNAGSMVTFAGTATPAGVTWQWRRNGTNISGATGSSLSLTNVDASRAGVYTLIASNANGTASSRGAQLVIRAAPVITQQPQSVTTNSGATVVLEAAATGTIPLNYQWKKDGLDLAGKTERRLFIISVGAADTGTYTLAVSNAAGVVVSSPATVSLATSFAGGTWRQIEPGLDVQIVNCAAAGPDGIYVGNYDGAISFTADGGQTWTRRSAAGLGSSITGLAYGAGKFVGYGSINNTPFSVTSSDGVTWKRNSISISSGITQRLRFNGSVFYGLAQGTYLVTTTNGTAWTQNYIGSSRAVMDVSYGNGRYVTVGQYGTVSTSTNGTSWSAVASGNTNHFAGVCFSPSGFVAVAWAGGMMTSSNGLTWVSQPAVTSQDINSVAYGNGRYVAVGGSRTTGALQEAVTLVSEDAVHWRRTSNTARDNLLHVTFANGLFVATGGSGFVFTSPDGEQWTLRRTPDPQRLCGIAHGNGVFAAVGEEGVIRNSQDGLNWQTERAGESEDFMTVGFGAGRFVVGARDGALFHSTDAVQWQRILSGAGTFSCIRYLNGQYFALTDSGEILRSPDALSWSRPPFVTGAPLKHILWDGEKYVIAGYDGTILTSADGETWTQQTTPTRKHLLGIAYDNGQFVAVGGEGVVLTSPDAVSWTLGSSGQTQGLYGVTYAAGQFIAVGWSGVILTSPDGYTWIQQTTGTTTGYDRVEYWNGTYVAVGGGYAASSSDGTNWTKVSSGIIDDVAFGNGKYVGVGIGGRLYTSLNLTAWTTGSIGSLTSYILTDLRFQDGQFVTCGRKGNILCSTNGQDWVPRTTGWTSGIEQLAYGAGRHVAVGTSGIILSSADTLTWTKYYASGVSQWNGLVYGGGLFVAVGWPGKIFTSPNGISWAQQTCPTTDQLESVAFGNGVYVTVGFTGVILASADGTNWAVQFTAPVGMSQVGFSNGRFVAITRSATVYTSTDGYAWSAAPDLPSSGYVLSIMEYSGATFVVGSGGTIFISADAPAITLQPISQEIRIGEPLTLSVEATGAGVLEYQWFRNGEPLDGETAPDLSRARTGYGDAGVYFVRVSGLGGATDSIQAAVRVSTTPYDAWRIGHFGEAAFLDPSKESSVWGNGADPDGDGRRNLLEYALGLDPLTRNTEPTLTPDVSTGVLRATFARRNNDSMLRVAPEISSDLAGWRSGAGFVQEILVVPAGAELDEVTVEDVEPVTPKPKRFMRLRVEIVPQ